MKLAVSFTKPNPEYDHETAKRFHFGKESDNNRRNLWSNSFKFDRPIKKHSIIDGGVYHFQGETTDNEPIDIKIPNLTIVECVFDEGVEEIVAAVSKKLILKMQQPVNSKHNITRIYFYFNETPYVRLNDGLYIATEDLLAVDGMPESMRTLVQQVHDRSAVDQDFD